MFRTWIAAVSFFALLTVSACASERVPPHETFTIESSVLGETRVVNAYIPDGLAPGSELLVMLDGGIKEDIPHIAGSIEDGVSRGAIRPILLIGIENTERRRDMTGPTNVASDKKVAPRVGGSAKFRAFIRDELLPEVERRYGAGRTKGLIGESAAGLFVVETFFTEPELFSHYIAISPSLWWNEAHLARHDGATVPALAAPAYLHLASAGETDVVPHVESLAAKLGQADSRMLAYTYVPRPDLQHATIYRALAPGLLSRLYPGSSEP